MDAIAAQRQAQAEARAAAQAAREAEERERAERQDEEKRLRHRESVWQALLTARGERYATCRLDNYEITTDSQQRVVDGLREYVADLEANLSAGTNLFLLGPAGTGKDHLTMAVCHQCVAAFRKVLWVNGTDLWALFRSFIGDKSSTRRGRACEWMDYIHDDAFDARLGYTERDVVNKLANVDVLAISDPVPPGGPLTDWQAGILFSIVDSRYAAKRPTFVTVNAASRADCDARMGASTVDRLIDGAWLLKCNWPSYRRKARTMGGDDKSE